MSDTNFQNEFIERLTRIEVKIDNIEKTKDDVEQLKRENVATRSKVDSHEKQILALQDTNKWLVRTLIAELISIGITVIIACINSGMKI